MISVDLKDDRSEIVHYDFEEYPIYIRKSMLSSYHNFEAPPHWHDDIELITVLQGEMEYNVNGEIITIQQDEGIFINSRQLHYGFSKTKEECEFLCILIHPIMLCSTQDLEQKYVIPLLKNKNISYIKLSEDLPWQRDMLKLTQSMYQEKEDITAPLTILSSFYKIWSLIYKNSQTINTLKKQNSNFMLLKNMIGYIQKFYKKKITLADIAKAGMVGQSKCCKLFDRYIGMTPNTYLIRYRLHQSTWYLKNTDMTITEIAQTVGFSGSSYYAEVFGKWYDKSPSEYRKEEKLS